MAVLERLRYQRLTVTRKKIAAAYINHRMCGVDNGRVLGYDNSHGYHHRHFMGTVEPVEFDTYEASHDRFQAEVFELWKEERTI